MAQDTPSRRLEQYIIRFPDGMRDRLKDEAAKNGRSLNAEIIQRLTASLELDDYVPKVNANEDTVGVKVVIPEDLAEAIQKAAEKQRRSLADQAISTLDAAYGHLK